MPGFGVQSAATTLVGQEMGAGNYKKAKIYGNISILLGCLIMTFMATLIFVLCPYIFKLLTPVEEVQVLAVTVLRIGCFAEPLYGVSIVASGALPSVCPGWAKRSRWRKSPPGVCLIIIPSFCTTAPWSCFMWDLFLLKRWHPCCGRFLPAWRAAVPQPRRKCLCRRPSPRRSRKLWRSRRQSCAWAL